MKKRSQKQSLKPHNWGEMLRKKRVEKGMTQAELSEKLNYPNPQFISLMERGLSKVPLGTMGRLIEILDLDEETVIQHLVRDYEVCVRQDLRKGRRG
ncbi:MAG: helix-turn-helix transcriptional regulator [Bdellovibrionaceae bacterium]|nr:helix-turn-helix transcriptional regulator [Pseudobdellovibrionaceae bacterium]